MKNKRRFSLTQPLPDHFDYLDSLSELEKAVDSIASSHPDGAENFIRLIVCLRDTDDSDTLTLLFELILTYAYTRTGHQRAAQAQYIKSLFQEQAAMKQGKKKQ